MKKIAVFFVGNRLHLDDGLGPAAYDMICEKFTTPENVDLFELGVLTMDMINYVNEYDVIITVDAIEHSGEPVGTILRGTPSDLAQAQGPALSLHDLRLIDLFDAAVLLDYSCEGICLGIQVADTEPAILTEGLTPKVSSALPSLIDALAAELAQLNAPLLIKSTGEPYLEPLP